MAKRAIVFFRLFLNTGNKMRPEEIKAEINQLELAEKILLVEDIWDSIAAENSELPMSEWQKQVLETRYKEYKKGSLELHNGKTVHEELRVTNNAKMSHFNN
jgi:putative addiction module component (TIGR02574 family)